MIIGSISENTNVEKRVAITPDVIKKYKSLGLDIHLSVNYASHLGIKDNEYEKEGANIISNSSEIIAKADVIVQMDILSDENLKSLNYSNLSGWQVTTDKVIVKMGKSDIGERVKLLKKIINNLNQNNLNVVNLDLRYQQGYVLKI